MVIWGNLYFTR